MGYKKRLYTSLGRFAMRKNQHGKIKVNARFLIKFQFDFHLSKHCLGFPSQLKSLTERKELYYLSVYMTEVMSAFL